VLDHDPLKGVETTSKPWIDYEGLSGPKKVLLWVVLVIAALVVAAIAWWLGIRPDEVPTGV